MSRARLAALLWLLFAFVLWNAIFDRQVDGAVWEYLRLESRHFQGHGPPVTVAGVVHPGVARGAMLATAVASTVAAAGLAAIAAASRGRRRRKAQN